MLQPTAFYLTYIRRAHQEKEGCESLAEDVLGAHSLVRRRWALMPVALYKVPTYCIVPQTSGLVGGLLSRNSGVPWFETNWRRII